jgi:uncharacterized protein YjbI with pentapeptide repeats
MNLFKRRQASQKPHSFTNEQIQAKAYELWLLRGIESSADDNWNDAIWLLKREKAIKQIIKPIQRLWWRTGLEQPVQRIWQWTGINEKRGWDFIQLVLVPITLLFATSALQQFSKHQEEQIEAEKAKQTTLTSYFNDMSTLLQKKKPDAPFDPNTFIIAQAKTITVLQSLDRTRQNRVIQFLESSDLSELLYQARMIKAKLKESDLSDAKFTETNFSFADLSGAELIGTNFIRANLTEANFVGANLYRVSFNGTDLRGVILKDAKLGEADLSGAKNLTDKQLETAKLCKTKLPQNSKLNPDRDCQELDMNSPGQEP